MSVPMMIVMVVLPDGKRAKVDELISVPTKHGMVHHVRLCNGKIVKKFTKLYRKCVKV